MNDHGYVIVFNILDSGYRQWWFPVLGFLVLVTGLVAIKHIEGRTGRKTVLKISFGVVFLLLTSAALAGTLGDYLYCSRSLAAGETSYVEGTVDNFVPMPYSGHTKETFSVKGIPFSYSDYVVTAGFNNTRSHGGPIQEGLPVRIWYVGNEIVKLEVRR